MYSPLTLKKNKSKQKPTQTKTEQTKILSFSHHNTLQIFV